MPASQFLPRSLTLDLTRPAAAPFRLTLVAEGGGTFHALPGGTGRLNGTLEFQGLPPGATIRSCRGFEATGAFLDVTPPEISVVPTPKKLWPPNHQLVPVALNISVVDDFDPDPVVRLVSIVSDQPDAGGGKGDVAGDIQDASFGADDRAVQLRAERNGNSGERTYTLTYEAEDFSGNVATATAIVTVAHDSRTTTSAAPGEVVAIPDRASGSIRFAFETTEAARGVLELFDLAGRKVIEIPFFGASGGSHEITWSGNGDHGGRAASGLYFGRLQLDQRGTITSRRFKVVVIR